MNEPYVHKIFINKVVQDSDNEIWLSKSGLATEESSDLDRAVMAYPIKHYTHWNDETEGDTMEAGAMGENLSTLEMDEYQVYIGDSYRVGDAIIQVSEPGSIENLPSPGSLRTGWYYRVLQEGKVNAGTDMELIERPYPEWSIAACNEVMHIYKDDLRTADDLAYCSLLSNRWKRALKKRLRGF
ncbi:MOSC domain-containing protein [Oceanobacillus sp. 143]|uniref:MOSC domain-containing protein n=1 Tax=Oceanobacillus zhaokaii TaxID=2052660 RepID=A0A345PDU2_9BACI|nr:MOSC domain-containing protein [Oceanobacillus zhaokaii]AXI08172.1 MOSC domain-containing protein [Oceanobacillus zhaokaii]QGS68117.1 MOSC domain-containing protein [Oceanobacillus sp. 143]